MFSDKKLIGVLGALLVLVLIPASYQFMNMQPKSASENLIRVACVGDSITQGSDYPSELWMLLGKNFSVGNFGVGGATVSLDAPTPYMKTSAFQDAKNLQPNVVIIMLGTNDANPSLHKFNYSFVDDYTSIVQSFKALTNKPQIWIVKPPPIFADGTGLSTAFFDSNVIPRVVEVANRAGLPIIDVYTALANYPEYFDDGVHPDSAGSKLIADVVFKAISVEL